MRVWMWHGGHDLRLEEHPTPTPGPDEVLVRVAACGVCGTDIHTLEGLFPPVKPPRVLGHEPAGVVEAVGAEVRQVAVGQTATIELGVPCGRCPYCRNGLENMCQHRRSVPRTSGGYGEYMCVPEASVVPVPDGIPPAVACLAEPVGCCIHAIDVAGIRSGATAAIVGAGPIGLILLQLARRSGAAQVIVSEPDSTRRCMAREMGADLAVDPAGEDLREAVLARTGGLGAEVAMEAVGRPELIGACLKLLRRGGQVVIVGVHPPGATLTLDLYALHERELSIRTAWGRALSFERAVRWLPQLNLAPLITHRFPLEAVPEALTPKPGRIKVVVEASS